MNFIKNYGLIIFIFALSRHVFAAQDSIFFPQSVEIKIGKFVFNIDTSFKVGYLVTDPHKPQFSIRPRNKSSNKSKAIMLSGITLLEKEKFKDYLGQNKYVSFNNKKDGTDCYYRYLKKMDLLEVMVNDGVFALYIFDTLNIIENAIDLKRYCNLEIKNLGRNNEN